MKCSQNQLTRDKLAKSFTKRKKTGFWSAVKRLKHKSTSQVPVVDGCVDPSEIADIFASNMSVLLKTHSSALRDSMLIAMKSLLTHNQLESMVVSVEEVHKKLFSTSRMENQIALAYSLNIENMLVLL